MSELEEKISSVLNNPEEFAKISQMAKSLMDSGILGSTAAEPKAESELGLDPTLLQKILGGFGSMGEQSKHHSVLHAISPYLDESHEKKLSRAMKMARMAKLAKTVMSEHGGDFFGDE